MSDFESRVRWLTDQYTFSFDPKTYHATYYSEPDDEVKFFLEGFHRVFTQEPTLMSRPPRQRRLLEFGSGPVPIYVAAASVYTSSITMSDVLDSNRQELQNWLAGAEAALEWTPFLEYLAELEGHRSGLAVEERTRKAVQMVVPCDGAAARPLQPGGTTELPGALRPPATQLYDVIMSTLCLEFASSTLEDFREMLRRLLELVRPGGCLVLAGALGNTYYQLGRSRYPSVRLSPEDLKAALKDLLILDFRVLKRQTSKEKPADHDAVFFLVAQK
ncbi:nicotinamide N-methyltransferase-like isoform X1 [Oratosquilla oratoria]|uniref:nicotinamide N-methyltransferase-like isoform X1 n=1 Tax=Oratosquilla oratoria TaxID=337810 RepID=UPI003F7573AA